jgi:2-(1,2-epoxy-1,2-dihydrophenyl)acetyl-CoA isomerase
VSDEPVLYSVAPSRVATITLNRPDKLNAFSPAMSLLVADHLDAAEADDDVGCVILTGAGKGFCAGGDLGTLAERDSGGVAGLADLERQAAERLLMHERVPLKLHELSKPTLAVLNGAAAGAGLSLAAACDIRVAAAGAKLTTAFARVGRSGDLGGTFFLSRLLGPSRSRELYFTAEVLSAERALEIGLVDHVYPADRLHEEADALARKIAAGPTGAIGRMKEAFRVAEEGDLRRLLVAEARLQSLSSLSEEGQEFLARFLASRRNRV